MISEEHLLNFDKLDIATKRNQIDNELITIAKILEAYEKEYGLNRNLDIRSDYLRNKNLTEAEILTYFYENIYKIEQELILYLSLINDAK